VLIKAVVQAIPTYSMGVFLLPKILCRRINSTIIKFWWGHQHNTSKAAWMRWERLGMPKHSGGMGFRDLEVFNLAILATILKEKYYRNVDFMNAQLGHNPSYAWQSIYKVRQVLERGLV
jgi:hypothetical protein